MATSSRVTDIGTLCDSCVLQMEFSRQKEFSERIQECDSLAALRTLLREITVVRLEEHEFSALYAAMIDRRMELLREQQARLQKPRLR